MNKRTVKTLAVTAALMALGTSSLFARNIPKEAAQEETTCLPRRLPAQAWVRTGKKNQHHSFTFPKGKMSFPAPQKAKENAEDKKPDVMGTVTKVSPENGTISVRDADGKETQVHVSPFTKIRKLPSKASKAEEAKTEGAKENASSENTPGKSSKGAKSEKKAKSPLQISDIQKDDFVAVKKIPTDTKNLEAGRIIVAR